MKLCFFQMKTICDCQFLSVSEMEMRWFVWVEQENSDLIEDSAATVNLKKAICFQCTPYGT